MNKHFYIIFSLIGVSFLLSSCAKSRGNNPGVEYAPDMYYDKGYEPFKEKDSNTLNRFGSNLREPVKGTIAVGKLDYAYLLDNNGEGYEASAIQIHYPEDFTFDSVRGERLYNIYCAPCHGVEGHNDGSVFKRVAAIKPPWKGYQDDYIKNLPVGKMYHVITYGKNNMGSHASVLTPEERWQVIAHIQELSGIGYHKNATVNNEQQDQQTTIQTNN
ncbi:MAG: cytochrome c [Bacteroidetes bacterium]|nr:cytochrome c [Bacteroidota bacterium]